MPKKTINFISIDYFLNAFVPLDVLTISLANTLLYLGNALELIAVLYLLNPFNPRNQMICIVLTLFNIIGFHLIILFYNEENIRIAFASIGTAILVIIPAYRMIREKSSSMLMRTMGYFYVLTVVSLLGRAAASLLSGISMSFFAPGVFQTFSFLALYLVMITGNTGFVLLLKERTDQELLRLANHDDMTGTLNRRWFNSRAKQDLSAYVKKHRPVTLLLFDVDQFKAINDTYGHDAGDQVLRDISNRILSVLGSEDLFSRYGGDEFAILLPGKGESESDKVAEQIRNTVNDGSFFNGYKINYTLSLGVITVIPDQGTQLEILYTSCDKALYTAKNKGRNCVFRTAHETIISV